MQNLITILLISFAIWLSNAVNLQDNSSAEEYFKVEVTQDSKVLEEKDDVIQLEKRPFKFKLTLSKTDNVFVSTAWGTYYYDYPTEKNIFECNDDRFLEECRFVSVKTGNEDKFNESKDIYVGDGDSQSVWFYDEEMDWHRMDRGVTVIDEVIHAEVTVENIFDIVKRNTREYEKSEYDYPIENIDQDIYVVMAHSHYESGMEHPKELQREKFILKFK